MKTTLFLLFIPLLFFIGCNQPVKKKSDDAVKSSEHERRFSIENKGTYKIVYVFAGKDARDTTYTYVLYHRGTEKPALNVNAQFVETPAENIACLSNVFAGCMHKLGLEDKIIAVDNIDYICNETIRKNFSDGKIKEIARNDELNIEQAILLKPGLIFTFGNGNAETTVNPKLLQAEIPVVVGADQFETTPLARASWLLFVAAFFEKESLADSILAETQKNYSRLKQLVAKASVRPSVVTEIKYNDTWYVPGGKSFMATMLNDAGADYCWKNDGNSGSLALAYEDVYVKTADADFWLNVHNWKSINDCIKQDERNKNFQAYKTGNIYNNDAWNNGKGGNAYWETGLISPDELLADLIKIFHPQLLPDHQLKYYRKLK